jgi:hypothetical protein
MSRGCPSIGSTAGGIPELLPSRRVYKSGSYKALKVLLEDLSREEMLKDALENFQRARDFDARILEVRRKEFFEVFGYDSLSWRATEVMVPGGRGK